MRYVLHDIEGDSKDGIVVHGFSQAKEIAKHNARIYQKYGCMSRVRSALTVCKEDIDADTYAYFDITCEWDSPDGEIRMYVRLFDLSTEVH